MLTQLIPDQISNFWDIIKFAVEESLPPIAGDSPDKMNKILAALLIGKAQCWASYIKGEEFNKFEGIVITKILFDDISDTKSLLIYCLYGYENVDKRSWLSGLKALTKYAMSQGCIQIVGYSNVSLILKVVKSLGGEAEQTFIKLPFV